MSIAYPPAGRRKLVRSAAICGALAWSVAGAPVRVRAAPLPALSKPPRLVHFVEAALPPSFVLSAPAEVILTIDVDAAGKVTAVTVARSAGEELDRAAEAAARQFVFEPGQADGRSVPVRITYSYRFVLKPPPPSPPASRAAAAQSIASGSFAGTVRRKGDRSPLGGVSVMVLGGPGARQLQAVTDGAGAFLFEALPIGEHAVELRSATTIPMDTKIVVHRDERSSASYFVEPRNRYASIVRGRRPTVEPIAQTLVPEEIQRIPGTQGDTLKAVQNLPGVARAPFGIGSLPVWGSAPEDTRVYVDGVAIPTLYHFGGLRSTVNSEMVQSLTFTPGAYGAEHGLGLGGVVEVESRRPRADGYHGYAQMDLLDGSVMLEGPVTKTLSFGVAGRRSWIDATLPLFTTSALQLSPIYYDYQARLSWRPTPRDDVDVFALGSDDRLKLIAAIKDDALAAAVDSHIYYHRGIASWLHRFGGGGTLSLVSSIGYDVPLQLGVEFGTVPTSIDTQTFEYSTRAVARLPVRGWLRVEGGIDFEGNRFAVDRTGIPGSTSDLLSVAGAGGIGGNGGFGGGVSGFGADQLLLYTNHVAPFAMATVSALGNRLTITPQLRLQILTFAGYQGSPDAFARGYLSPEPRLAARYQMTRRLAVKAAAGLYTQAPDAPDFSRLFGNPNLRPEHSAQYMVGAELDLARSLHVELDGFYKSLSSLVVAGENPGDPPLDNDGIGRAYGGELLVRQELWKGFFGWLSYTLSRSERRDHVDQAWHVFEFDQTHILTLTVSDALPRGFQVGARYRFVTGSPYTPVTGAFYDSITDRYTPIAGAPFSARLGAFSQLDVRVDKIWTFDRWRFSVYLDVQNVLQASNPEAVAYNFDFRLPSPVTGLPLLPIIGVRGDF